MNARAMVFASFAADALALGGHWVYNADVIEKKYGRLDRYEKPLGRSYHPTKNKGQFTHYGDQMLLLLEDIVAADGFDPEHFANTWQQFFSTYDGYFDRATKTTLENFRNGRNFRDSGSDSTDLSAAARISPIIYYCHTTKGNFLPAVRAQTAMTHNHPDVVKSAVFFSDIAFRVLNGQTPTAAIDEAIDSCSGQKNMIRWVRQGKESIDRDTREAIAAFGQQCETEAAFPGVIHLIYKYENDLKNALIENVMAGGDSAARGLVVGMILGAHTGIDAIAGHWLSDMKAFPRISHLLEQIDHSASKNK
ncbi:MAG: ADP-ribosylglycohydrolase family protein [Desulfobacterales bacterium]|jgi:ADP-ribosylglycohydrolase|nr:ADP-ribosylglycohydrolase family protein [Desulfobacterales bacterium]